MFSLLQRHILKECFARKGEKVSRRIFNVFYKNKKNKQKDLVNTITKCLERLINRGLLIGYGTRTTKKWFIREVKLTKLGIKKYVEWLASRQARLF
ncbi:MAG: hypothetical protein WCX97_03795 [Candidatus Magasanikbacteria bacterium]